LRKPSGYFAIGLKHCHFARDRRMAVLRMLADVADEPTRISGTRVARSMRERNTDVNAFVTVSERED
jgi:hypothetical protein